MKKITVIQPLLPYYSICFFNEISKNKQSSLTILADIKTKNPLNQYEKNQDYNFNVIHLENKSIKGIYFRPSILKMLRSLESELVVFNANPRDLSQILVMILFFITRRKFYCWGMFHRIGGPNLFSNIYYRLVGFLADKCLCYTRVGANKLIQLGVNKNKIKIIGTAIDESKAVSYRKSITTSDIEKFKIENNLLDKKIVLQVVRLSKIKKPELLIDAARIILEKQNDIEFIIIGDGELRKDLEERARKFKISESIRFLGSIYDEAILSKWYMSADAFVIPTCIGLSAHHAMSYGLPIITDDSLNNQASEFDILYNGLNSITYQEGNINSLAETIVTLVNNQKLKNFISNNAIHTVETIHSLENKTKNFLSVL